MEKLKLAAAGRWLSLVCASLGILTVLPEAADAQSTLTSARVELTRNQVRLHSNGRSRRARVSDVLGIGDSLSTARRARAELRFNDGSLARIGESAVFQFTPNTRNFRLSNGTVLLLIPPGQGRTTIQTPNAVTGIQGSALFVRFVPETNTTIIGALTNNPEGLMMAFNEDGTEQQPLAAGEMAVVRDGLPIEHLIFDMDMFYETNSLDDGLELTNPESSLGDDGLDAVKQEIQDALIQQDPFDQLDGTDNVIENPAFLSANPAAARGPRATVPEFEVSPAAVFLRQDVIADGFATRVDSAADRDVPQPPQPPARPRPPVAQPPNPPVARPPVTPPNPQPPQVDPPVKPVEPPVAGPVNPPVEPPIEQPNIPEPTIPDPVEPIVKPPTPDPVFAEQPVPEPLPEPIPEINRPNTGPVNLPVEKPVELPPEPIIPEIVEPVEQVIPPGEDAFSTIDDINNVAEPETEAQLDRLPDAVVVQGVTPPETPGSEQVPAEQTPPPGQVEATPGQSGAEPPGQSGANPGQGNNI